MGFSGGSDGKESACNTVRSLGGEDCPGGGNGQRDLVSQPLALQRAGHHWATNTFTLCVLLKCKALDAWNYVLYIFVIPISMSTMRCTQWSEVKSLSRVRLCGPTRLLSPWDFPGKSIELPFPAPGDLPDPGIEPGSPALEADALPTKPPGKPTRYTVGTQYLWIELCDSIVVVKRRYQKSTT